MLRILMMVVVVFAALWFFLKDAPSSTRIAEDEREQLDLARQGVEATEAMAEQMAAQSDAIRDEAISNIGSRTGSSAGSAIDMAGQAAEMQGGER